MTDVREMTRSAEILDSRAMSSSVIPSAKYSCAGSGVRFSSGRTAREWISGRLAGAADRARVPVDFQRTKPASRAAAIPAAAIQDFPRVCGRGATAAVMRGCDVVLIAPATAPLSSSRISRRRSIAMSRADW